MAWTNLTFNYGSVLTSAKMTQMYDNMVAISPLYASGNFGTLLAFTRITSTNAAWSPNASTKKMVVLVVGGGGPGGAGGAGLSGTAYGEGGGGGSGGRKEWGVSTSVSGTYAATVGGSATASSFIGTGLSVTAPAGSTGAAGISQFSTIAATRGKNGGGDGGGAGGNVETAGTNGTANTGGGGGGGGGSALTGTSPAGGSGGSGIIYVWEYA